NLRDTSLPQPTGREIVIEHFVEPVYPRSAIDAGIEGVAVFGIQVAATGDVLHAWLVDSEVSGDCNIEAQRALLQWRFAPYLVDGRPAPFLKYYRIRFHFRDELRDGRRATLETESSPPVLDTGLSAGRDSAGGRARCARRLTTLSRERCR
ncbi:MAG: TonB family protein, partial [Candidatus Eisenbacteria sp.]|nr:TonB family protein [Candidatus Eisenbacteria bacterium]